MRFNTAPGGINDTHAGRSFFRSDLLDPAQLAELATLLNQLDALGRANAELMEVCTAFEARAVRDGD